MTALSTCDDGQFDLKSGILLGHLLAVPLRAVYHKK